MKKLIAILVALSVVTVLTAASCGGSGSSGGTGGSGGTGVHMGETTFLQPSVTISKGSSLNLIDDVPVLHIIGNGSWVNNVAKPAIDPGALWRRAQVRSSWKMYRKSVLNIRCSGSSLELRVRLSDHRYLLWGAYHKLELCCGTLSIPYCAAPVSFDMSKRWRIVSP